VNELVYDEGFVSAFGADFWIGGFAGVDWHGERIDEDSSNACHCPVCDQTFPCRIDVWPPTLLEQSL
jgi:hypothetical protein